MRRLRTALGLALREKNPMTDRRWKFNPQPDITAAEVLGVLILAGVLRIGGSVYESKENPIPQELKRHFDLFPAPPAADDLMARARFFTS